MKTNFHKILFFTTIAFFTIILIQTIWHPINFKPLKGVTVKTELPKFTFESYSSNKFQSQFEKYTKENCETIIENRAWTTAELQKRGFELTDSKTNFVFAKHPSVSGETVYTELKKRGVLVRHFTADRVCDYNRITIGTKEQMEAFIATVSDILTEL